MAQTDDAVGQVMSVQHIHWWLELTESVIYRKYARQVIILAASVGSGAMARQSRDQLTAHQLIDENADEESTLVCTDDLSIVEVGQAGLC